MEGENNKKKRWCCGDGNTFWAWFFIGFGGYFLLRDLGIIPGDLPIWPIIIILIGVFLLFRSK